MTEPTLQAVIAELQGAVRNLTGLLAHQDAALTEVRGSVAELARVVQGRNSMEESGAAAAAPTAQPPGMAILRLPFSLPPVFRGEPGACKGFAMQFSLFF